MKRGRDEKSQREAPPVRACAHCQCCARGRSLTFIHIRIHNRDDIRNKVRTISEEGSRKPKAEKGEERLVHAGYSKMAVEFRLT